MRHRTETSLRGSALIQSPLLNKGTAFTVEERETLGLAGYLPPTVESIEEQLVRIEQQYATWSNDLDRHIYLRQLQDANEVLFARFLRENVERTLPVVYTPTVGDACVRFSEMHRRPRGLFLSYPQRGKLDEILATVDGDIDVIVVTDGERILGLGDQGAGGMGIPIGKLSLYTVFGGIDPGRVLPIMLDVGTNNATRLADPLYLGWRSERVTGDSYLEFVDEFVHAVKTRFPDVLLQWEDFAQHNATVLLDRYSDVIASFNDDIQGTAAVALAAVWSAVRATGGRLEDQTFCIAGAGSAGTGIGSMLRDALVTCGVDDPTASIYMLDSKGLLTDDRTSVKPHQEAFVQPFGRVASWADESGTDLASVCQNVSPSVLIGVSGQPRTFTEEIIAGMAQANEHPIVFPLSNPTNLAEAIPTDILRWSGGRAVVATGSPFDDLVVDGQKYSISQANNVYVFPGLGLGVVLANANRVTEHMMMTAASKLSEHRTGRPTHEGILPDFDEVPELSLVMARAVADCAVTEGVAAPFTEDQWNERVRKHYWTPEYQALSPS